MNRRVVVSPQARRDLLRLNVFLAGNSDKAARRAMDVIGAGLRGIGEYPERGRDIGNGLRSLPIPFGHSGYVVRYRVASDHILVARVFHMREDR